MSNANQNKNYHWNNGAFCENCGILTGNVKYTMRHDGCKPGCKSTWDYEFFCPTSDYETARKHHDFKSKLHMIEEEILRNPDNKFVYEKEYEKEYEEEEEEEEEEEDDDDDNEDPFQGDNFDDYFEDQNEVEEPEQVLLLTTIDGKNYVKCEKTGIIYDYEKYKETFVLVILGKWNEDAHKIDTYTQEEPLQEHIELDDMTDIPSRDQNMYDDSRYDTDDEYVLPRGLPPFQKHANGGYPINRLP